MQKVIYVKKSDTDEEPNEDDDEEAGDQIEVETVVPYRDSDSESEPEQLRSVSDFDLLSGNDEEESTALAALAFSYVRSPGRRAGSRCGLGWPNCRLIQRQ